MSGIKNLKEKSKIQLDEMFDTKPVGKPDIQTTGKEEDKQTVQPDTQQIINPITQFFNKPETPLASSLLPQESTSETIKQSSQPEIQLSGKLESLQDTKPETHIARHTHIFPAKQPQPQKAATYKMTFNLTEDIYKAFNDLYANRMLQGRKTEKSEMICEAIQWLIKMEEGSIH